MLIVLKTPECFEFNDDAKVVIKNGEHEIEVDFKVVDTYGWKKALHNPSCVPITLREEICFNNGYNHLLNELKLCEALVRSVC